MNPKTTLIGAGTRPTMTMTNSQVIASGIFREERMLHFAEVLRQFASRCYWSLFNVAKQQATDIADLKTTFKVGLDDISRWDQEIQEEETRFSLELEPKLKLHYTYALHQYIKELYTNENPINLRIRVPSLQEFLYSFIKRVAQSRIISNMTYFKEDLLDSEERTMIMDSIRAALFDCTVHNVDFDRLTDVSTLNDIGAGSSVNLSSRQVPQTPKALLTRARNNYATTPKVLSEKTEKKEKTGMTPKVLPEVLAKQMTPKVSAQTSAQKVATPKPRTPLILPVIAPPLIPSTIPAESEKKDAIAMKDVKDAKETDGEKKNLIESLKKNEIKAECVGNAENNLPSAQFFNPINTNTTEIKNEAKLNLPIAAVVSSTTTIPTGPTETEQKLLPLPLPEVTVPAPAVNNLPMLPPILPVLPPPLPSFIDPPKEAMPGVVSLPEIISVPPVRNVSELFEKNETKVEETTNSTSTINTSTNTTNTSKEVQIGSPLTDDSSDKKTKKKGKKGKSKRTKSKSRSRSRSRSRSKSPKKKSPKVEMQVMTQADQEVESFEKEEKQKESENKEKDETSLDNQVKDESNKKKKKKKKKKHRHRSKSRSHSSASSSSEDDVDENASILSHTSLQSYASLAGTRERHARVKGFF